MTKAVATKTRARAGKYLGFRLADELFAVEVLVAREIIEMQRVTRLPRTPHYVLGMINLRGKIVPVVDLRLKLGLQDAGAERETRIVVVEVRGMRTGVVVDGVSEVLDIAAGQIEVPPHLGEGADVAYLLGIAKVKDQVFILMNLESVLSAEDVVQLSRLAGAAGESAQE
jgi:purine-binding chemotaxis protein CheW